MAGVEKLQDTNYKNYLKAVYCLWITKKGLEDFACEKSEQFRQQVLDSLHQKHITSAGGPICTVSYDKKKTLSAACQHLYCNSFVKEVVHLANPFKIQEFNLNNSDHTLWLSTPWELSKLFMNRGQLPTQKCPGDTDLSGIINFLQHCPVANSGISSTQKLYNVRAVRNKLMHNANLTVDSSTLQSMAKDLVTLLEDAKELGKRAETLEAVRKITEVITPEFQLDKNHESLEALRRLNELSEKVSNNVRQLRQLKDETTQLKEKVDKQTANQQPLAQEKLTVEEWINEDRLFVETAAFKYVFEEIMRKQVITITGVSGSGKTAMARHIAIQLKAKGYIIIPICSINEIRTCSLDPNLKQLHVLDDPVGKEGLDKCTLPLVKSCHDQIMILLKKSRIKIIFTCRRHIIQHLSLAFDGSVINLNVIDLNQDMFRLTKQEKDDMLQIHLDNAPKTHSEESVISVSEIETFNFPLLCKLFSVNRHYRKQGHHFFINHFDVIVDEVDKLKHTDRLNYCSLVLCMVFSNKFNLKHLDVFGSESPEKNKIRQLLGACGKSPNTPFQRIKERMATLESVYLTKTGDEYSFMHDSLYEAVAFAFGNEYPKELLEYCTSSFVRTHIRLSRSPEGYYIVLAPEHYSELCKRLIRDLQDGKYHDVFFGLLQDKELHTRFYDCLCSLDRQALERILFEIDVNFEELKSCLRQTNTATGLSYDSTAITFLTNKYVKCIHFLLATGPHNISKFCLEKFDFSQEHRTNLCLWPVIGLSGNLDNFKLLQESGYRGLFSEKWFGTGMSLLHTSVLSGNIKMVRLIMPHYSDLNHICAFGNTALMYAACRGYKDICEALLQSVNDDINDTTEKPLCNDNKSENNSSHNFRKGADVDLCGFDGDSPLYIAAQNGHPDCLQVLLQHGAAVDLCDNDGISPVNAAAQNGHHDCLQLLLQHGATIDLCDDDGTSPFYATAQHGHPDCLYLLLQRGATVDLCDNDGISPLYIAAYHGHYQCLQLLLQHGAHVDLCNNNGTFPLYAATQNGRPDCLQLLLQHGATIDLCDSDGTSPVSWAAYIGHRQCLQLLLEYGAHVDLCDNDGKSPVNKAACKGHHQCLQLLLQHGATVDLYDNYGRSPVYTAAYNGHLDCLQLLLQHGATVDLCDNYGRSPTYIAAYHGHHQCLQLLLQHEATVDLCDDDGRSPLYIAAYHGHFDCLQLLLKHGATVDFCDSHGTSPLYITAQNGHADCLQFLLQHGAHVDLCDNDGKSPVYWAAYNGDHQCLQHLLLHGATVELCDYKGTSPFFAAAQNGHPDCLQLLLQHEATVDLCDNDGTSPLFIAAYHGHYQCLQLLLQQGATVDLCDNDGTSPLYAAAQNGHSDCLQLLLQHEATVDLCDNDGTSPLYIAAYHGHYQCLQLLLQQGATVDLCDNDGISPVNLAAYNGDHQCLQLLLQHGAAVDLCDNDGTSPLYSAAHNGHPDCLQLLLQYGATVDLCDNDGRSPLYSAAHNGHPDCLPLLLQYGATVDLCNIDGTSPLNSAAQNGHLDCLQLLLQHAATVDLCDNISRSPLYSAAYHGHHQCLQLLLHHEATVDLCDNNGTSPLIAAAQNGHPDCRQLLLQHRAHVDFCDNDGKSPVNVAAQNGHHDCLQLLLQHGAHVDFL